MITLPTTTKAILFDLGGVLLNLQLHKTFTAFEQLGLYNFSKEFDSYSGSPFIEQFEEGKITSEQFVETIKSRCNPNTTTAQILTAWNAMLGEFPLKKLALLQQLAKQYKLLLYSNTNALHVAHLHLYYNNLFGNNTMQHLFEKMYFSNEVGIRKPNPEGFTFILNEQHLEPNQVFYIDDGSMHIAAAKALGLHTYLTPQNADLIVKGFND